MAAMYGPDWRTTEDSDDRRTEIGRSSAPSRATSGRRRGGGGRAGRGARAQKPPVPPAVPTTDTVDLPDSSYFIILSFSSIASNIL